MRYPIYIPSRGRPQRQRTVAALNALGVTPTIVVAPDDHDTYTRHNPGANVIAYEPRFYDDYERTPELDPHPTTGAAHNYAWHHARTHGHTHHWVMDDNIYRFKVYQHGRRMYVADTAPLDAVETWALRWANLAGVALQQYQFMRRANQPTFTFNTKLYCATLYRNDLHHDGIAWRRGINDDTIVSIDILKAGWCTATCERVGIVKQQTGTTTDKRQSGGMTDVYRTAKFEGKTSELVRLHPDVAKPSIRFGRIHHTCDYRPFDRPLIPAPDGYWNTINLTEPDDTAVTRPR